MACFCYCTFSHEICTTLHSQLRSKFQLRQLEVINHDRIREMGGVYSYQLLVNKQ